MESNKKSYYFFSTEGYSPELPIRVTLVRQLRTENGREAILVECEKSIKDYGTRFLVLVPKQIQDSFLDIKESKAVFSYVINGAKYINQEMIDLHGGNSLIMDWGGLCLSYEVAKKWQYFEE